jgi:hypothetical protein
MTKINFLPLLLILLIALITTGCIKVKDFTKDDIKWFGPYNKTDTVIFISNNMELDTMIFYKKVAASDTFRNFSQGFYNENYLTVQYKIAERSYHHFALMGDGKKRYDQDVVNISKPSYANYSVLEITFLGSIFNGKELNAIKKINENVYYFNSNKATYHGMDVEKGKGIKDFIFDTNIGIVKYTDDRNIEWKRK